MLCLAVTMVRMKKLRLKNRLKRSEKPTKTAKVSLKIRIRDRVLSWDLRKLTRTMVLMSIPIALVGTYLWYNRLYLNDERRVWSAINNSMATQSVTRTLTSGGTGNKVVQYQQFFYAPQAVTKSKVTFSQKSATIETNVATEGISYLDKQYSRYTLFNTNQKKPDGSYPTLDSILYKWGKNDMTPQEQLSAREGYIGELISLAIFGNYDAQFRSETISKMKAQNVYEIDLASITRENIDDRSIMSVPVKVRLKPFATLLQSAFVKAGYGAFEPLNPDNFKEDSTLGATFLIDRKNNTIYGVQYGDRQEKYTGYGVNQQVEEPVSDISADDLEAKVREEISGVL